MNSNIPSMFVIELPPDGNAARGEMLSTLVSADIITEPFCCDIAACHGQCCEEGNAGAPVTLEEVAEIEAQLDELWPQLSARAQAIIDKQGVAYTDQEGDLVTSVINEITPTGSNGNCVFRGAQGCLLKMRPISCHLYPIRVKQMGDVTALNYDRWSICKAAILKGRAEGIPVYRFLREPLIRRFGEAWYEELCTVAELYRKND